MREQRSVRLREYRMHVCGPDFVGARGCNRRGWNLETRGDRVGESVNRKDHNQLRHVPLGHLVSRG